MVTSDLRSQAHDSTTTDFDDIEAARRDPNRVEFYSNDPEVQRRFVEAAERLGLSFSDLGVFCRHGLAYEQIPLGKANQKGMLAYLRKAETPPPKWVMISGLYPDFYLSEPERRKRLRALYRAVVLLVKRALGRAAADAFREERSVCWEPVAEVCRDLEIAPSKLSALMKEFCGHSLIQLIDCVRVERLRKVLKIQVRKFVREWIAHRATLGAEKQVEVTAFAVWKDLKASRKWPAFCQNSWAVELGFASYRRMYRACLMVWKQSPHQMEMGFIEACLKESVEVEETEPVEVPISEIEELVRGIGAYCDEG